MKRSATQRFVMWNADRRIFDIIKCFEPKCFACNIAVECSSTYCFYVRRARVCFPAWCMVCKSQKCQKTHTNTTLINFTRKTNLQPIFTFIKNSQRRWRRWRRRQHWLWNRLGVYTKENIMLLLLCLFSLSVCNFCQQSYSAAHRSVPCTAHGWCPKIDFILNDYSLSLSSSPSLCISLDDTNVNKL